LKGNIAVNHEQIIRAWKDSNYRSCLSAEELDQMPASPAGEVLSEVELNGVVGGSNASHNVYAKNTGDVCNTYNVSQSGVVISGSYIGGDYNNSQDCSVTVSDSYNDIYGY